MLGDAGKCVGVSACRRVGVSAYRRIGVSAYRRVGVSAYRRIGVSVCRWLGHAWGEKATGWKPIEDRPQGQSYSGLGPRLLSPLTTDN
jgi:hypothetical protein